jgi:DNA-directed RNA polymerase I, II, and III subunit RPABC2
MSHKKAKLKTTSKLLKSPRRAPKKVNEESNETVDYDDTDSAEPADEIDNIPELYDIDDTNSLKDRYEYNPEVRKETVYLTANNRRTSENMSQFEYTEIIGQRAKQIELGGPCFTTTDGISDPIKKAEKEMRDRKCPIDIVRHLSAYVAERWHANEMGFIEI